MSISLNNIESRVTALENKVIHTSMKVTKILNVSETTLHNKTYNLTDSIRNYDELLFIAGGNDSITGGIYKVHGRLYTPEINNKESYSTELSAADNNFFFKFPSDTKIHIFYAYGDSSLYGIYGVKYILNLYYKFKEVISHVNLLK